MDFEKLVKLMEKEVLSLRELQQLAGEEHVAAVTQAKPDDKYKGCLKYDVRLENGDLYFVYVKR